MNAEGIKKLVNGAIENEFYHIQEHEEQLEIKTNEDVREWYEKSNQILEKLLEVAPEYRDLIDDMDNVLASYSISLCKYYFKRGILDAYTNLKFLEDIPNAYLY